MTRRTLKYSGVGKAIGGLLAIGMSCFALATELPMKSQLDRISRGGNAEVLGEAPKGAPRVYFSPKDQLAEKLISLIEKENRSIRIAVYHLEHRRIAQSLLQARKRGVKIELIVDPFTLKKKSWLGKMARQGIEVFVWAPTLRGHSSVSLQEQQGTKRPRMHHRFCIFGDQIVWTGSFDLTYESSTFHQGNVVVLEDRSTAEKYAVQFEGLKNHDCISYADYMAFRAKKQALKS